jgi:antirestriction protein ArdC
MCHNHASLKQCHAGSRLAAFGSADYSREELIAEMGSAFLYAEAGIESRLDNSAAYLKGWFKALKGDACMIMMVASATPQTSEFIFGRNAQESAEDESANER